MDIRPVTNRNVRTRRRIKETGQWAPGPMPWSYLELDGDLAYLIGVYLGDGSAFFTKTNPPHGSYAFQLGVTDQDFRDYTSDVLSRRIGCTVHKQTNVYHTRPNNQPKHQVRVYHKDLFMTLTRWTNNKKRIPKALWEASLPVRIRFLEGILDSEATILPTRHNNGRATAGLRIQIVVAGRWAKSLMHFVQECRIRVGRFSRATPCSLTKTPAFTFRASAIDFVRAGGRLHIERKQRRLDSPSSQTGRETDSNESEGTVGRTLTAVR